MNATGVAKMVAIVRGVPLSHFFVVLTPRVGDILPLVVIILGKGINGG